MRLSISLGFACVAFLLDFQSGVLASDHSTDTDHSGDHSSEHSDEHSSDHSDEHTSDHTEEHSADHEEDHGSEHTEEHSTDHEEGHDSEHSEDHSSDHSDEHAGDHDEGTTAAPHDETHSAPSHGETHSATDCAGELGHLYPTVLPGMTQKKGENDSIFLSRTSWRPVKDLPITETEMGVEFGTTQLGYSTLIGDNGFPQYYQLKKALLTKPKHQVMTFNFDLELQIASYRQETVWKFDMDDMVVTSFFFSAMENTVDVNYNSTLIKQVLDARKAHGDTINGTAGVDLQRALGPQLKGTFYAYRTSSSHCSRASWYVFAQPIAMSTAQKEELESLFPVAFSPSHGGDHEVSKPEVSFTDMFMEEKMAQFDFYLDRDTGRNRTDKGDYLILLPIFGTVLLTSAVMMSLFVSDKPGASTLEMMATKGYSTEATVIGSPSAYP